MQRRSIGHSVSVSNFRKSPNWFCSDATFSTRFSMRTPHWPARYTPGSIEVIMPSCIAMCGSGTAREMLCGPSCTLRK